MTEPNTREQLCDETDAVLLQAVRFVKQALEQADGMDDLRGAAAILAQARQRIKDAGISKLVQPGSDLARLAEEISKGGFTPTVVEPVDDEPDAATDGLERVAAGE